MIIEGLTSDASKVASSSDDSHRMILSGVCLVASEVVRPVRQDVMLGGLEIKFSFP